MSESPAPVASPPGNRTRALRRRRLRRYAAGVVVLLLFALAVVAGVLSRSPGGTPTRPTAAPGASSTSLDSVDVSRLLLTRGPFCDRLDQADVQEAIGASVASTAHYTVGERAVLVPGVRDLSHEYDCTFRSTVGGQARAWVFAEPVSRRVARALVRAARAEKGCTVETSGPRFGIPSVATRCPARTYPGGAPARAVTLRGLFGHAWLSCQLSLPSSDKDVVGRAQRWCVRAATSMAAHP